MFNMKWDKRTAWNIVKFPFIILGIPVTLFFWGIEWVSDWSEIVTDKLPKWDR
jgi:hypothetical protein